MFVYVYDINAILMRCLKTKAGEEHLQTFKDGHALLLRRGIQPKYCRMDDECSSPIKQFIKDENMDLQLTPPQMHRRNWAERAIQTGKAHLIAGLVGINPNFLLHLWCRLIPQCEQTLNMMRPTHINPKISADTYLQGTHDFNRAPLAPPGILTVIHKSPDTRKSYAPHGLKGWYVGGAPEH